MQGIDAPTVVALLAIVVSVGTTIILAIRGYSVANRDAEVNRRLGALEAQQQHLTNQLHADQIETERLKGEVALVKQQNDYHARAMDGMSRFVQDVPRRDEWESRLNGIETQLAALTKALTGRTPMPSPVPRPRERGPGEYEFGTGLGERPKNR